METTTIITTITIIIVGDQTAGVPIVGDLIVGTQAIQTGDRIGNIDLKQGAVVLDDYLGGFI